MHAATGSAGVPVVTGAPPSPPSSPATPASVPPLLDDAPPLDAAGLPELAPPPLVPAPLPPALVAGLLEEHAARAPAPASTPRQARVAIPARAFGAASRFSMTLGNSNLHTA
jgi:hypothetical protein